MTRAPLRPLSIGNVVSTGLVLYRSNLMTYFLIALRAYVWIILPLILIVVSSGLFLVNRQYPWLLLAIAFVLLIAGTAKYQANAALIARLAYQELIGKPESVTQARRTIDPKLWRFWSVAFSIGIRLTLVYLVAALGFGLISGIFVGMLGRGLNPILSGFFVGAVLVIAVVILLSWYFARWMIAEVPLAVESNLTAGESIKRSWDLTQNSASRVQGIVLIGFLVTLPILGLTSYLPDILFLKAVPGSSLFWVGRLISFVFSMLGSILVLPLWQTLKSAIYYDLRTRREGFDIQLRHRKNNQDDNEFI